MTNFFIHVFYFINIYYKQDRGRAFFGLFGMFSLNIMAVSWIFNLDFMERFMTGDPLTDRWVVIPLVTSPILLGIYGYYRANKEKVERIIQELDENERFRKKEKVKAIIYILFSVIFWIAAIFIPPISF